MRVKICGITNLDDALLCIEEGADALGFIFTPLSPRFINYDKADSIIGRLSPFVLKIGVFVNEKYSTVNKIASQIGLNAVQLHGEETPDYVKKISLPVIKSFRVHPKFSFSSIKQFTDCVYLLDTFSEKSLGGTGETFKWSRIPKKLRKDIILGGGVSSANIRKIHEEINPGAVDISSSLESSPGIKDAHKVKLFFNEINKIRKDKC